MALDDSQIVKGQLQPSCGVTRENEPVLSEAQSAELCCGPALMICSVVGLVCLVSFLSGVVNRRLAAAQRTTCNSSVCVHFSDVINRSATARAPPCSDFYAHVCAEWDEDNMESPQELNFRSVVRRLYLSLAMEPVPEKYQTNFQKAAAFYQSCLSVLLDGKSELTEISSTLKKIGVHWPERSASADLLVTAANLKQRLDLDSVFVFSMPDTSTLSIEPPSTGWLHDVKRQRYAVDFANNSREQFNSLWRAFSFRPPNDTEVARLLETEDRFFHYIALAVPLSMNPSITTLTLLNLPLTCSEFSRARWNKLFREGYHVLPEAVTAVQIKYRKAFDFACRLVRDLGESAVQYYVEWLAVKALATYGDRSIAKFFWSNADATPFGAQSTCFQSTMRLFGEVILLEESHRWHLRTSMLLSKSHLVAKRVRASLSELIGNSRNHPLMNVFLKYSLHDELYNDDRQHLLDSVYATVPDLTRGFFFNRMLLLNVSLNQDTVRSLGFSWEALEDMLRHDGGTVHIQLAALQHHVRMFLQLSYAAYFLLNEDMPSVYNYAALGMLVARQVLAFRRHTLLMAQTYQESIPMHAEEFEGDLEDYSEFSLALDTAQKAVFRTRQYQAQPRLRKSQDFFLLTCFQLCSGRNTNEAQTKLTFAFTRSKSFQAAFSCRSALEQDIASVLSQVKGEQNSSDVCVSKDVTSLK